MSSVDKIKWAMSLRDPQYEALQYFDAILHIDWVL